jgi:alkanesulfonate monooxygenase
MTASLRTLEFGWFLPTAGDTITYGSRDGMVPPSMDLFEKIARAAETAGFEYLLVPVASTCWDAYISSAMVLARTSTIKMLVAARPGYVNPVLLARMIGAMDQLSGGRVAVNLIAGQSDDEALQDGIRLAKEDRYAQMDEDVTIMKALWSGAAPVNFDGRFHVLKGARVAPRPEHQPRFYLGGGSREAWEVSARHADVHLFWGDTVETIAANMVTLREILQGGAWTTNKMEIPLALGKDVGGADMVFDLASAPHLLVAGATGAGVERRTRGGSWWYGAAQMRADHLQSKPPATTVVYIGFRCAKTP